MDTQMDTPKVTIRHTFNILSDNVICIDNTRYEINGKKLFNDKANVIIDAVDTFTFGEQFGFVYCFAIYKDYLYIYDLSFGKPQITRDLPLSGFSNMCFANDLLYLQVKNVVFVYDYSNDRLVNRVELVVGEKLKFEYQKNIITHTHNRINYYTLNMSLDKHLLVKFINAIGVSINGKLTYRDDNGVYEL